MNKPRVLMAHNFYKQEGGEDVVFAAEKSLLRSQGHQVFEYTDTNFRLDTLGLLESARNTIWSTSSYLEIKKLIGDVKPDIAHFHNTFLMISPSAYYACKELGIPVVQSLHNYRLGCPSAIFYRNGHNCEDCLGKTIAWPGILHHCYRDSSSHTLVVASMLAYHKFRRTWHDQVNAFIVATDFARGMMIRAGLPADRLFVKPNFSYDATRDSGSTGDFALVPGRLTRDKGVATVLAAWKNLNDLPLKITGDGELWQDVKQAAMDNPAVEYLGFVDRTHILDLMQNARFLIFPSRMYEVFPMVIAEAYACGVPVIASRIGVMTELVSDGETGLLFDPNDPADLAVKARWLWDHPERARIMGQNAHREYEEKYSPEKNYQLLIKIYGKAMNSEAKI